MGELASSSDSAVTVRAGVVGRARSAQRHNSCPSCPADPPPPAPFASDRLLVGKVGRRPVRLPDDEAPVPPAIQRVANVRRGDDGAQCRVAQLEPALARGRNLTKPPSTRNRNGLSAGKVP